MACEMSYGIVIPENSFGKDCFQGF